MFSAHGSSLSRVIAPRIPSIFASYRDNVLFRQFVQSPPCGGTISILIQPRTIVENEPSKVCYEGLTPCTYTPWIPFPQPSGLPKKKTCILPGMARCPARRLEKQEGAIYRKGAVPSADVSDADGPIRCSGFLFGRRLDFRSDPFLVFVIVLVCVYQIKSFVLVGLVGV